MADLGDIGIRVYDVIRGFSNSITPGPIAQAAVNISSWGWPWYSNASQPDSVVITLPSEQAVTALFANRYVVSAVPFDGEATFYDISDGVYDLLFSDKQVWEMRVEGGEATFTSYGKPLPGDGYLAGDFPGGITTVDAVPTAADVRVLYRPTAGEPGDGVLVAQVQSAPDGTWRVDGLNPALRYDVVGRKAGLKDVIMSNVQPKVD